MPSTQISFTLLAFMLRAQDFADLRARRKVLGTIAYTLRVKRLLRSARAQQVASNVALGLKPQARVPTGLFRTRVLPQRPDTCLCLLAG